MGQSSSHSVVFHSLLVRASLSSCHQGRERRRLGFECKGRGAGGAEGGSDGAGERCLTFLRVQVVCGVGAQEGGVEAVSLLGERGTCCDGAGTDAGTVHTV